MTTAECKGMIKAIQGGDDSSIGPWADSIDEAGGAELAGAVRTFSALASQIFPTVLSILHQGTPTGRVTQWFWRTGESFTMAGGGPELHAMVTAIISGRSTSGTGGVPALKPILDHWNESHPIVEWFASKCGFVTAQLIIEGDTLFGEMMAVLDRKKIDLRKGHLQPLETHARVHGVRLAMVGHRYPS